MDRLPPVDATHCDVAAISKELQALRAEVRSAADLRDEVSRVTSELLKVRADLDELRQLSVRPQTVDNSTIDQEVSAASGLSFATLASDMKKTGVKELPKTKKTVRPPVVGRSTNTKLKSVTTVREVNIFVSRLHPSTVANELHECVSEVVGNLSMESITCAKLNSKFAELYSSYHVAVKVNANDFSAAIDMLNAPDAWPSGALVRRYFKPRNG